MLTGDPVSKEVMASLKVTPEYVLQSSCGHLCINEHTRTYTQTHTQTESLEELQEGSQNEQYGFHEGRFLGNMNATTGDSLICAVSDQYTSAGETEREKQRDSI